MPILAECSEQSGAKHVPNVPHAPNVPNTSIVPVQDRLCIDMYGSRLRKMLLKGLPGGGDGGVFSVGGG